MKLTYLQKNYFINLLIQKHLDYLSKRNFNIDTIHKFELGSSINSFDLQKTLKQF